MASPPSASALAELLRDPDTRLTDAVLRQLSDIDPASLEAVLPAWSGMEPERRRAGFARMTELFEEDTRLSYEDFARAAVADPDPLARAACIRLLVESEDPADARLLLDILEHDADLDPRLEAARALGTFVELGELEELDPQVYEGVTEGLLNILQTDGPIKIQRAALESLGYSSRPEVAELISRYLAHPDPQWVASAVTALERSGDSRWEDHVLELLTSPDAEVRAAACQAAGSLNLEAARPLLLKLLEDEEDSDVTLAAIWSLSQIGGEDVEVTLESLLDATEDEELIDFLEEALENLALTEGTRDLPFLEIEAEDDADEASASPRSEPR